MEPYTRNGGIIGKKRKYGTTVAPLLSSSYATIQYVGGRTQTGTGTTADITVALTGLSGGLASSPSANDLVIITFATPSSVNLTYRIAGYTSITDLYANDTYDANMQLGYKFMGATPDATASITAGSGTGNPFAIIVTVWRNIDLTTPLDVVTRTRAATNTSTPVHNDITPITPGARIIVASASAHASGNGIFSNAGFLNNFLSTGIGFSGTQSIIVGIGDAVWTSGLYTPTTWGSSVATATTHSNVSATMALRPSTILVYGNKQNSGIWDLATTSTAPTIAANNVFSRPRDIFSWCSTATLNACTISQDTTIVSPFNNTPLKMTITGDSDPYILTTGAATWNIAAAAVGQTWEFSVWAMTDLATSGELYIFEANSGHVWVQVSSYTMPLKQYWKQFKVRRTFTDATTAFVQVRLDGQNTGGSGYSIWFDGLQVRRIV